MVHRLPLLYSTSGGFLTRCLFSRRACRALLRHAHDFVLIAAVSASSGRVAGRDSSAIKGEWYPPWGTHDISCPPSIHSPHSMFQIHLSQHTPIRLHHSLGLWAVSPHWANTGHPIGIRICQLVGPRVPIKTGRISQQLLGFGDESVLPR